MKKLFFNWKMMGNKALIGELAPILDAGAIEGSYELCVFPPSVYVETLRAHLSCTEVLLGMQNISGHPNGAYTGEVSAAMAEDLGLDMVLAGHSERRQYQGETDKQVAAQVYQAELHDLKSVICVGETLAEREAAEVKSVLRKQLTVGLSQASATPLVAYEPVWAIGTGLVPTEKQIKEAIGFVRKILHGLEPAWESASVLYGGSVNADNLQKILAIAGVDGCLIGGASLKADQLRLMLGVSG